MSVPGRWDDLTIRLSSGVAMVLAGILAIFLGGIWFSLLIAVIAGMMIWELSRMCAPGAGGIAVASGVAAGAYLVAVPYLDPFWALSLALGLTIVTAIRVRTNRTVFAFFYLAILAAAYGMAVFRETAGAAFVFWLVIVVVVTDVFGYFAGRHIGGRKFWPRVSPKKTWAGTMAGWISAGVVGALFAMLTGAERDLIWVSVLAALASQLGDIAESALKRRAGVKDSSNLLPGHGGVFDRFDGLMGAALFMVAVWFAWDVPQVVF